PAGPGPDARRSGSRKPDRPVLGAACTLVGAQLGETEARALAAIGRCASSQRGKWLTQASWAAPRSRASAGRQTQPAGDRGRRSHQRGRERRAGEEEAGGEPEVDRLL